MKLTNSTQFIKSVTWNGERIPATNRFPFYLPAVRSLEEVDFHPTITILVGENGMGKSTLLEAVAIAYGFNPEGGTLHFNFSSYDSHSELDRYIRLVKGVKRPTDSFFFRAETFYNVASNIEELDKGPGGGKVIDGFGGRSLHKQSHGESFFAAFLHRFRGNGLYILDEPEAALSPLRQMSMLARIHELIEQGSQFIISTHSPILMAYPGAKILQLTESGIEEVRLEDTSHYTIMKQFFEDKDRLLHHLFQ
ncbi:AAA family ATPase [Sediminibacillus halophilus]|uniref:Predicted ATPase n=1 Tax=Sediminibacillus halophilus TaxID=482461 RepID=A0A1G9P3Q6_9BACI|nr:AAA family ATPase [Sediminibacillus halophilus]SDL93289.1 Predicted ATPase [Sediminibacillus halophilus]